MNIKAQNIALYLDRTIDKTMVIKAGIPTKNTDQNTSDEALKNLHEKYEGCYLSTSSWANISEFNEETEENLSLSLRAKLLYGKHLFEDLVSSKNFGSATQIAKTLDKCNKAGVLVIEEDNLTQAKETKESKETGMFGTRLYSILSDWLK